MDAFNKIKTLSKLTIAIAAIISLLLVSSCLKKDDPVVLPSHDRNAQVASVNMGEDYRREVYFDLGTKDTSGSDYQAWDLAFETGNAGFHIWINGGKGIFAAQTSGSLLSVIPDTAAMDWKYDAPSWNADSTAIGNWTLPANHQVYIISRSASPANPDKFWKIIFKEVNPNSYTIEFCRLNETAGKTMTINKPENHGYAYFSFDNYGTVVNKEPEKTRWDILFTHYRYVFNQYNPPMLYPVTGVLLNPYLTFAAIDSVTGYAAIDYSFAKTLALSQRRDIIGFEWKYVVLSQSSSYYEMRPYYVYIIKDQQGYYYKLHFIDFYDSLGKKGVPKFEYQRL